MPNFYDNWLQAWDETVAIRQKARTVIHEEEIEWLETPQDHRVGLLIAPESGFVTWGSETSIAEIPPGWHTGKHVHGEEGIFILEGEGCSIINGQRYNWSKGSTLWIPFGAEHQHYNQGEETVRYHSVTAANLERFIGLLKLDQLEECGPTRRKIHEPLAETGFDQKGRRICLRWEEAPRKYGSEEGRRNDTSPIMADDAQLATARAHHSMLIQFMRNKANNNNGFHNKEIEISGILSDFPHTHGGRHAHMEAILYFIQGEGYSIVDGQRVPWKKGTAMHVQGPQTMHQHFNESDVESHMLRMEGGIRSQFFQKIAQERFPYLWYEGHGTD